MKLISRTYTWNMPLLSCRDFKSEKERPIMKIIVSNKTNLTQYLKFTLHT